MFEIEGIDEPMARRALQLGASKLPLRTRFVTREELEGE
jgi:large subunit ribosomal protein L16